MSFDGEEYRVRLVKDLEKDSEGRLESASDFAKSRYLNNFPFLNRKTDVFFEVESVEKDLKNYLAGGFYLGMIYGENGSYKYGTHVEPKVGGGGTFLPSFFFGYKKNVEMIMELGSKLPLEVSKKISDLYHLSMGDFLKKGVETNFEFEEWQKSMKALGLLN